MTHMSREMRMEKVWYSSDPARWRLALAGAFLISLFVLGAFYYWFAVADRYVVFLYGHVATGIPRTEPFDEITRSRYWMSGLVVSGAVMVIYTGLNWVLGRVGAWCQRDYGPPPWWQVWALGAIPLGVGIPLITMTVNLPTLPPALAAACVGATLVGLALALLPGSWAAQHPLDLLWLAMDGAGLMPVLLLLRVVELPGRRLSIGASVAAVLALGSLLAAAGWLGVMTGLRAWRRKPLPSAGALFAAGLCASYLLLPLAHYLLGKPAYRYITTASNFFAFNMGLQILILIAGAGIAIGVTHIRKRLPPWLVSQDPQGNR
jgi:hypothetical protein